MTNTPREYEVAMDKAWADIESITEENAHSVRFLADEYAVDVAQKSVLSLSCNTPPKTFLAILILHYLKESLVGLPPVSGKWMAFRELVGGEGYYTAFKKRVLDRLTRKYGGDPDALVGLTKRFKAKTSDLADISIVLETFEGVPVLLEMWKADDEFGASSDLLFDKSIVGILPTEDIVVLSEIVISSV